MDVAVPEAIVSASERVDLGAIIRCVQRLQQRLASAFFFDPKEPDASLLFAPSVA